MKPIDLVYQRMNRQYGLQRPGMARGFMSVLDPIAAMFPRPSIRVLTDEDACRADAEAMASDWIQVIDTAGNGERSGESF
jgi:hypothetical protein